MLPIAVLYDVYVVVGLILYKIYVQRVENHLVLVAILYALRWANTNGPLSSNTSSLTNFQCLDSNKQTGVIMSNNWSSKDFRVQLCLEHPRILEKNFSSTFKDERSISQHQFLNDFIVWLLFNAMAGLHFLRDLPLMLKFNVVRCLHKSHSLN